MTESLLIFKLPSFHLIACIVTTRAHCLDFPSISQKEASSLSIVFMPQTHQTFDDRGANHCSACFDCTPIVRWPCESILLLSTHCVNWVWLYCKGLPREIWQSKWDECNIFLPFDSFYFMQGIAVFWSVKQTLLKVDHTIRPLIVSIDVHEA